MLEITNPIRSARVTASTQLAQLDRIRARLLVEHSGGGAGIRSLSALLIQSFVRAHPRSSLLLPYRLELARDSLQIREEADGAIIADERVLVSEHSAFDLSVLSRNVSEVGSGKNDAVLMLRAAAGKFVHPGMCGLPLSHAFVVPLSSHPCAYELIIATLSPSGFRWSATVAANLRHALIIAKGMLRC